jgi:hypothetical protein
MTMRELADWMRAPVPIQVLRTKASSCVAHLYAAGKFEIIKICCSLKIDFQRLRLVFVFNQTNAFTQHLG